MSCQFYSLLSTCPAAELSKVVQPDILLLSNYTSVSCMSKQCMMCSSALPSSQTLADDGCMCILNIVSDCGFCQCRRSPAAAPTDPDADHNCHRTFTWWSACDPKRPAACVLTGARRHPGHPVCDNSRPHVHIHGKSLPPLLCVVWRTMNL